MGKSVFDDVASVFDNIASVSESIASVFFDVELTKFWKWIKDFHSLILPF